MSARGVGLTSVSVALLVLGAVGLLLAQDSPSEISGPAVSGALAFSEAIVFDYDRDGTQERVQFWIEFEARPAPGEPSPEVESGSLRYYVFDLDSKRRVDDWMLGFNMTMGGGFPRAGEAYPLTNVRITGRQAQFELAGTAWTIVDGGDSWEQDTIEVRDVNGVRKGRFHGGDVRVVPDPLAPRPLDIAANRECNGCHGSAATRIATGGGPHRELECADCHAEHPPEAEGARPQCLGCHEPHAAGMDDAACVACHRGHAPARLAYAATIPAAYCAACHGGVAETLRSSRSLHMGLSCAICHRTEHGATESCQFCHRATHPEHGMEQDGGCGSCHGTAHRLESRRSR